ncbi:MAG: hypothetical protein R2699_13325 [Acidimicrobiales bacterium]
MWSANTSGGTGAALAAVDRDEVGSLTSGSHALDQRVPERLLTDCRLDPDRQPRALRQGFDQVDHGVDVTEGRVERRAVAVDPHRDAAQLRQLGGDLGRRHQSTEPRLGPLGQLDLDGAHRGGGGSLDRPLQREAPVLVPTTEVAGADLPHELAAVQMVGRDPAFAGVVQAAGHRRPPVEGLDRRTRQRPEAHRRDVDDGVGAERPRPVAPGTEDLGARDVLGPGGGVVGHDRRRQRGRQRRVLDDQVLLGVLDVVVGAEAEVGVAALGRRVHPATLVAGERTLLVVVGDDVLAQLRSDALEPEPEVPDDREVPQDGVAALRQVARRDGTQRSGGQGGHGQRSSTHGAHRTACYGRTRHACQVRVRDVQGDDVRNAVTVVLFIVAVGAIAVAWWGIAKRVVKHRTRKDLARLGPTPTEDQLKGLMLHNAEDGRVRQATGELDRDQLGALLDDVRSVQKDEPTG